MAQLQSLFPLQLKNQKAIIYRGLYCIKMTELDPLFQNRGGSSDSGASKGYLKSIEMGSTAGVLPSVFPRVF